MPIDPHYALGGLFILIGSIGFIKGFDLLAHLTAKRLLAMAASLSAGNAH